jgi:hypothetical protein
LDPRAIVAEGEQVVDGAQLGNVKLQLASISGTVSQLHAVIAKRDRPGDRVLCVHSSLKLARFSRQEDREYGGDAVWARVLPRIEVPIPEESFLRIRPEIAAMIEWHGVESLTINDQIPRARTAE